ncbi:PAS domain S-box-containing protein/diguanylate cyclase (GGDEF)-like protein [Halanaerobium sp. DL-01]|uniref:diguanylate cyclase domain-containing protein n=1 Tax=Halanaerobium sp. DL-01 TaxID=1653064 RepID=UPI000DF45537|nr:diguanylate cyclase [Halanaerobium sp. DL-01]RCW82529.1 PAS domain S-box-containing protein/diguanylate cyclase (GGDEF)-like protein [Halanaerobium sp. DL-01]
MNLKNKDIVFIILIAIFLINFRAGAQDIIINEIMSSNQETIQDEDSDFNDWLELKNIGEEEINLSGYYLTDKKDELTRWQFDPNKDYIIHPGGYLLIWADEEPNEGKLHTNFKLSSSGEKIILTEPDGVSIANQVKFPQIMTDVSFGRKSTNPSKWVYFISPTPERKNNLGISSYYWTEKIKFLADNKIIVSLFLISFLIILILLFSYYKTNKKLEISKIKYKNLFEECPIGLIRCDIKGNILDANKEMVKLFGAADKEKIKEINLNNIEKFKDIWNNKFLSSKNEDIIEGDLEYTTNWGKKVFFKYKIAIILSKKKGSEIIIAVNDISREKEIEKDLKYFSFHDELTDLYNRRYFENEIKRLDAKRQLPISIIIADFNGLKIINDSYGHKKGDEILIQAAQILNESFREEDILARYGGDEFAVLLPNTTKEAVERIIKRIKEKCKNTNNDLISISLGSATKEKPEQDINEILKKADDNMYKNKLSESRSSKSNIVQGIIKILNEKSNETKEHSLRMTKMAFELSKKLNLSNTEQKRLSILAALHDIGKINIDENILKKKGSLNDNEWEAIKKHSEYGYKIAKSSEVFAEVADDILAHHEYWNGEGYPNGLEKEEIPYLARIITIIDAYDVMTHDSSYSKAVSKEEALKEIENCAGSQFDPYLSEVFIKMVRNQERCE